MGATFVSKNRKMFNEDHFIAWREARIKKLVSILGLDWFNGKNILELGCGFGHIGKELKKLGSVVTFAEGRREYIPYIMDDNSDSEIYVIDNDRPWSLDKQFDLVVHWGLLYHLKYWEKDIMNCLRHTNLVSIETEVVDSDDQFLEIEVKEDHYDAALNSIGVRPSVGNIENFLKSLGCELKRYDDADLNSSYMVYDWKSGSFPRQWKLGHRRFWMVKK